MVRKNSKNKKTTLDKQNVGESLEPSYLPGMKTDTKEKSTSGTREYPTRLTERYKSRLPLLPARRLYTIYKNIDATDVQPKITPKCTFPDRSWHNPNNIQNMNGPDRSGSSCKLVFILNGLRIESIRCVI
jgi:hypothetical protein